MFKLNSTAKSTHREIADAIDAGSVSTVKVAIQHLEYFGKVEVTRRPGATAGKNLPNVYRITGEEFDWEPTPKEPREPGQIFAAYRRRHAEIEAERLRSYEELEQSHRQREQDLLRRIGELEAAVNGHAPRQREDAALPMSETPGRRETAILPEPAPQPSPDNPGLPESFRNGTPEPSEDIPAGGTAGPPQSHVREPDGQELDSRETAIAHACLVCLNALLRSDVGLEREGLLDDPDYIEGLSEEEKAKYARRNVFPFSMSVAAHEVLQLVGLLAGFPRIWGAGPQRYDCYPGTMKVDRNAKCDEGCEFAELTATAVDLTSNLDL